MQHYSQKSNSDPYSPEIQETTSSSAHSEEEVTTNLAATNPKRRAGRKKFKETRHPVYRGVRLRSNSDKWICELREPRHQKRIWLGTYPTPEMAARAHDLAALALKGTAACLNFADSAWRLPLLSSTDPKVLRKAAAEAAEAFRPGAAEEGAYVDEVRDTAAFSGMFDVEICEGSGVAGLADGVLMSPPPVMGWSFGWDDVESDAEVELKLWSF